MFFSFRFPVSGFRLHVSSHPQIFIEEVEISHCAFVNEEWSISESQESVRFVFKSGNIVVRVPYMLHLNIV